MNTSPIELLDIKKKRQPRSTDRLTHKAVLVRLEIGLLAQIDAMAEAGYRSRTAEINLRLEQSLQGESIDEHGVIVRHVPGLAK